MRAYKTLATEYRYYTEMTEFVFIRHDGVRGGKIERERGEGERKFRFFFFLGTRHECCLCILHNYSNAYC